MRASGQMDGALYFQHSLSWSVFHWPVPSTIHVGARMSLKRQSDVSTDYGCEHCEDPLGSIKKIKGVSLILGFWALFHAAPQYAELHEKVTFSIYYKYYCSKWKKSCRVQYQIQNSTPVHVFRFFLEQESHLSPIWGIWSTCLQVDVYCNHARVCSLNLSMLVQSYSILQRTSVSVQFHKLYWAASLIKWFMNAPCA